MQIPSKLAKATLVSLTSPCLTSPIGDLSGSGFLEQHLHPPPPVAPRSSPRNGIHTPVMLGIFSATSMPSGPLEQPKLRRYREKPTMSESLIRTCEPSLPLPAAYMAVWAM